MVCTVTNTYTNTEYTTEWGKIAAQITSQVQMNFFAPLCMFGLHNFFSPAQNFSLLKLSLPEYIDRMGHKNLQLTSCKCTFD